MSLAGKMENVLTIAEKAARHAAGTAGADISRLRKVEVDLRRDVKIAADRKLDSVIVGYLTKRTAFPILSEESGGVRSERTKSKYRWIVDPLDGSLNFSRGIPLCAVSIALWEGMEPVLGVIYDFFHGELFKGLVGYGAFLNGKLIKVSAVKEKQQAVLATGFPAYSDFSRERLSEMVADIRSYKKVRLFGSAAISLAYVASGRVDCYREDNIKLWDVAAGLAIVKAAGGIVKISGSGTGNGYNVKASNKCL